jgi:hypothetical protein
MVTTLGLETVCRWLRPSLGERVPGERQTPRRSAPRWPRDARLLTTALACCAAGFAGRAQAQDTIPWRIVQIDIESSVTSSYGSGYGYYVSCEYATDTTSSSWQSEVGLQGTFAASAHASYDCCWKGGYYYGYSYYCDTYSIGLTSEISIGSTSFSVHPGSCMEFENCSGRVWFTISFDRPMRMVWDACLSGFDAGYHEPCPFDGSYDYAGSVDFPNAGSYGYYHQYTSYSFVFDGSAGEWSFAYDVRFERMYPADVVPDRVVDGSDLSAILSKWGGPYDPQRTAADVNLDGKVDAEDLAAVLFAWGTPG